MHKLWALDAYEISKLFRTKEVSAIEICNQIIQHIENINPKLNAIVAKTFDDALETAGKLDKKLKNG